MPKGQDQVNIVEVYSCLKRLCLFVLSEGPPSCYNWNDLCNTVVILEFETLFEGPSDSSAYILKVWLFIYVVNTKMS